MSPKNIGKNTATNGVGSMVPYRGSGSMPVSSSKGRKSRGLRNTTGAFSPCQCARAMVSIDDRAAEAALQRPREPRLAAGGEPSVQDEEPWRDGRESQRLQPGELVAQRHPRAQQLRGVAGQEIHPLAPNSLQLHRDG